MNLTLGFSPCPNDTFIFDALVNNKIDTQGISFNLALEDVETLNRLALKNTLDVTKLSYGVLPLAMKDYIILNSGGALGTGVGPLLVANNDISINAIEDYTIAIQKALTYNFDKEKFAAHISTTFDASVIVSQYEKTFEDLLVSQP